MILGEWVRPGTGTGLTHLAPAFSVVGLAAAARHGLPVPQPIGPDGRLGPGFGLASGMFFADAAADLITELRERGLLFAADPQRRQAQHCPHCSVPLLRSARSAWYLRSPDEVPAGDPGPTGWIVARTRIWGTPLPIWECDQGHLSRAGSLAELAELAGRDLSGLDPHRPRIDQVTITCQDCGKAASRVPEVLEDRYDAAVASVAAGGGHRAAGPGGLITSGQDPAWPDALGVVLRCFGQPVPVTAAGGARALLDDQDQEMSSARGTSVPAAPLVDRYGADALRWYCLAASDPGWPDRSTRPGPDEITTRVLLRYWQAAAYLTRSVSASRAAGSERSDPGLAPPLDNRPALDRWLISELNRAVLDVTAELRAGDAARAERLIEGFIAGLAGWYLRRARRRLRAGADAADGASAVVTLQEVVRTLTLLMAPFAPFMTDRVWRSIRTPDLPGSVHLCQWPAADETAIDIELSAQMALVRRLARLGRRARESADLPAAQRLERAWISSDGFLSLPTELKAELARDLRVAGLKAARPTRQASGQPGLAVGRGGEAVWLDPGLTAAMRMAELTAIQARSA